MDMSIESRSRQYGKVFDHWQIKEFLGSGSGGKTAVFRLQRSDSSWGACALKIVNLIEERGDVETLSDFRRREYETAREECSRSTEQEVRLMDELRGNTNIVDYLDHTFVDWSDEFGFGRDLLIRMELLEDLRSDLKNGRMFSQEEVLKIGRDICAALMLCHKKNILHRDVKPENIFRNKDGNYKLGDFGVSRVLDACPGAVASTGIGTYEYWPAEQMTGRYDKRVDIYSLGLVLYELSNRNRLPFAASTYATGKEVSLRLSGSALPTPSEAGPVLAKVILKATAFKPEDRYQSAEFFLKALAQAEQKIEKMPKLPDAPESRYATIPAQSAVDSEATPEVQSHQNGRPVENVQPIKSKESTGGSYQKEQNRRKKKRGKGTPVFLAVLVLCIAATGCFIAPRVWKTIIYSPEDRLLEVEQKEETFFASEGSQADRDSTELLTSDQPEAGYDALQKTNIENSTVPQAGRMRTECVERAQDEGQSGFGDTVFGQNILRDDVTSITFLNSLSEAKQNAWDISENSDGSVLAWVSGDQGNYSLFIAGEGGVKAPENCRGLFAGYKYVNRIVFNDSFFTTGVTDMSWMFYECFSLRDLSLDDFDTTHVTTMEGMFRSCSNLNKLDLSHFNTSQVTNMRLMFGYCHQIKEINTQSFDTGHVTDMSWMFSNCTNLYSLSLGHFDTTQVTTMQGMFSGCRSLTELDISHFNTSQVTNMSSMFRGCQCIENLDLRSFDFSSVEDYSGFMDTGKTYNNHPWKTLFLRNVMKGDYVEIDVDETGELIIPPVFGTSIMRDEIRSITFLDTTSSAPDDAWDFSIDKTGSVLAWVTGEKPRYDLYIAGEGGVVAPEDCHSLFASYFNVEEIHFGTVFDTSIVTDMGSMFLGCQNLTALDVSSFDTVHVTNMNGMFCGCEKLSSLDVRNFNTSQTMYTALMFSYCKTLTRLDLSCFDTSLVTDMGWMFYGCENLQDLDLSSFDTSQVRDMSFMFGFCNNLRDLNLSSFDTSQVTDMSSMFYSCYGLTNLDLSGFDFSNVTSYDSFMSENTTYHGEPWQHLFN